MFFPCLELDSNYAYEYGYVNWHNNDMVFFYPDFTGKKNYLPKYYTSKNIYSNTIFIYFLEFFLSSVDTQYEYYTLNINN